MLKTHRIAIGLLLIGVVTTACGTANAIADQIGIVVLQTDFGLKDQAVAAMRGVIRNVDRRVIVDDLTHEIPAYNIWEAAYRLNAVIDYWAADTVFVSVVDPGVGTARKSIVARLENGQKVVTPDNGTLTLIADRIGIDAVREIDERAHRLPGSGDSYTFHGRDVYAYVGALLASGKLQFDAVGPRQGDIVRLEYERATVANGRLAGGIPVLDPQYGNVWTNIPASDLKALGVRLGDRVTLTISAAGRELVTLTMPYVHTFGNVPDGESLLYANSVGMLAVALNQRNFAQTYRIASGPTWRVDIAPARATAAPAELR
jgi:S-adenosylmethionine hydrolase